MKQFQDLGFSDSFMFGKVMEDPALCRRVLETLLQTEIGELSTPLREKEVKITKGGKAIRLDVFAKSTDDGTIYDAEMQNRNGQSIEYMALPKRSRYYQATIDTNELSPNDSYSGLADTNIVFICTFDPFEKGCYRYTFREYFEEVPGLLHPIGTSKIYYNTVACGDSIPKEIQNLFDYINTGTVSDTLTGEIETMVDRRKFDGDTFREYMMERLWWNDAIREGRLEGLNEGRAEGREEGRAEGLAEGRIEALVSMLQNGGTDEMLKTYLNATDDEISLAKERLSSVESFND